ncbi:MAG: heme-binding protein [Clostridia bacterium]|nr:heme-binding protein [Clostridia bacterium]
MMDDYALIAKTAKEQEDLLRFDHFTARDAWELGAFIVSRVYEEGLDMAVCIRKLNGHILFQHCTQGTTLSNQSWMQRKFNTALLTEGSSLRAWATLNLKGQTPQDQGVSPLEYAYCGGAFPIRLKSGELIGMVIVSNLPHRDDHRFLVRCLAEYLGINGAAEI